MKPSRENCPGCQRVELSDPWVIASQPSVLNYRFPTALAAGQVPRVDLELRECGSCGLIFNGAFDESKVWYDAGYDNRQHFSTVFLDHLNDVTERLGSLAPASGTVCEIGCGKGDFLKLLCNQLGRKGEGFDTTCELEGENDGCTFHRRYARLEDAHEKVGLVVCRHVIEHVPEIGDFFNFLYDFATKSGAEVTYLETPAWDWIEANGAFWDVFNEHCNYFRAATLAGLARAAGFTVLRHDAVFGGQYQGLYLGVEESRCVLSDFDAGDNQASWRELVAGFIARNEELQQMIRERCLGGNWAIWGAGAKGVTLANRLEPPPRFIVDVNPEKAGSFVPGIAIPVVGPGHPLLETVNFILVANPNYIGEIQAVVKERNPKADLMVC